MRDDISPTSEYWPLFDGLVSQTASEEELAALYEQLEDSLVLQKAFLEYCQLHIDLSFELCANQACDSFLSCLLWADDLSATLEREPSWLAPRSQKAMRGESPLPATATLHSVWRKTLSRMPLPLVFMIGVLSTLVCTRHISTPEVPTASPLVLQPQPSVPPTGDLVVAQLVSNTGLVFDVSDGKRSVELENGAPLRCEQLLNIPRGVAQIAFSSGADLQVEGPVVLLIDAMGIPELRYGKVFAKAQGGLEGFAIETALGTIWLDGDDAAGITLYGKDLQIHGFDGEVDVTFKDGGLDSRIVSRRKLLRRMLMPDGTLQVSEKKYVPDLFSALLSIRDDVLLMTEAYGKAVREAQPFCHWRFENIVEGFIPNEMSDKYPLRVGGAASLTPAGPDNHVIEFGYGSSSGYLIAEEPLTELINSDYTFETWVKPGHSQWGTIAALALRRSSTSDLERHALVLELTGISANRSVNTRLDSVRFVHRSPPGPVGGASCVSNQDYLYRKWQHVVAVREGTSLRLFVDGKPVAGREYRPQLEDELELVIGQLFSFDTIRPLVGQLDEFAIYNRALSQAEIQTHHAMLRPGEQSHLGKTKKKGDTN